MGIYWMFKFQAWFFICISNIEFDFYFQEINWGITKAPAWSTSWFEKGKVFVVLNDYSKFQDAGFMYGAFTYIYVLLCWFIRGYFFQFHRVLLTMLTLLQELSLIGTMFTCCIFSVILFFYYILFYYLKYWRRQYADCLVIIGIILGYLMVAAHWFL